MKILNISPNLHTQRIIKPSFTQLVDYGAKDKDLVYVPILFEEEDTFTPSALQPPMPQSDNTEGTKRTPKKLGGKILKTGGTIVAGIELVPEVAQNAMNKVSDLMKTTKDFAKDSIDNVSEIKEHYREKFPKAKQNDKTNNREEIDEFLSHNTDSHGNTNITDPHEVDEFSQFENSDSNHLEGQEIFGFEQQNAGNFDYDDLGDIDYDY